MSHLGKRNIFSQPKPNNVPVESPDGVLLTFTLPDGDEAIPGTLIVWNDGIKKTDRLDFNLDVGNKTFTFVVDASNPNRMNVPPCYGEEITLFYFRKRKCKT